VGGVEAKHTLPHRKVLVPPTEPHFRAGQGVVALHDGGVERKGVGRVEEVEQVGRSRAEPLDGLRGQLVYGRHDLGFGVAAKTDIEKPTEGTLVLRVLVDVRDALASRGTRGRPP
jgi:hypothetical protein